MQLDYSFAVPLPVVSTTSVSILLYTTTATTETYTLSLHDALPISFDGALPRSRTVRIPSVMAFASAKVCARSEEHTSELQSQFHLVCRLLLEKKKEY